MERLLLLLYVSYFRLKSQPATRKRCSLYIRRRSQISRCLPYRLSSVPFLCIGTRSKKRNANNHRKGEPSGPDPVTTWPPDIHLIDPESDETNAWSNLKDIHYDVYIREQPDSQDPTESDAVIARLKELCRQTMEADSSSCCDGACDECPINGVLDTLQPEDEDKDEET